MFRLWVFIFEYDSNCFRGVTHFEFDSCSTHDLLVSKICFVIRFSIYFDGLDIDILFVYFGGQYGESLSICQM